jgi:23S rRNA pseudouridine1911/1915/1917 synthase
VARAEGVIDKPIGRDPRDRTRMAIRPAGQGRRAVTHYRVLERLAEYTALEARLQTGRTHQIRVHLTDLGHPIAGDATYSGRRRRELPVALEGLALHAMALAFTHPATQERMTFGSTLPPRIQRLLSHLRYPL